MARLPRRTFTWLDAIALVSATALGGWWVASTWYFDSFDSIADMIPCFPEMSLPPLTAWTLAVVALRLLPPRPLLRRVVRQPGAAASGAVAAVFTLANIDGFGGPIPDISPEQSAIAVAIVWGLLRAGRACRPEPSWIDRLGRAIGLSWILLDLRFVYEYAHLQWITSGG